MSSESGKSSKNREKALEASERNIEKPKLLVNDEVPTWILLFSQTDHRQALW